MTSVDSIVIKDLLGNTMFKLDAASIEITDRRSTEPVEIPGQPWNLWFDNHNVQASLKITGIFKGTDATWDGTYFTGRPFDFIHQLRSLLSRVDATTGATLTPSTTYKAFQLEIHQVYNGVEKTYNLSTRYSGISIYFLPTTAGHYKVSGGSPGVVDYDLEFDEVSDVLNLGMSDSS